jgi:hypothetical protein
MIRRLTLGLAALSIVVLYGALARPLPRRNPDPMVGQSGDPLPRPHRKRNDPRQRGVALGLFAEDISFSYAPLLKEIAELGASHVALIVPIYQQDATSTRLYLHTRLSPTLETIADTIRQAHRDELEVTLFPIVRLLGPRSPDEWRGTLQPTDRDAWFASYGQILGDLASIASLTGATRLVIGSELSSLDGDLPRWRKLIQYTRAVYAGTLVYSANWDHYEDAALFELVDEIGVVGYFKLREPNQPPTVEVLSAGWRRISRDLQSDLAKYDKPFVFTEVGYRSRQGATAAPWDETPGGTSDMLEQQRGFEAFREVWTRPGLDHARLDGIYVWNWYGYGGPGTTSYTPRGKPAVATIRQILLDLEQP